VLCAVCCVLCVGCVWCVLRVHGLFRAGNRDLSPCVRHSSYCRRGGPHLFLCVRMPASGWSTCDSIECDVVRAYGVFDYLTTRNSSIATNQGPWSERQGGGCVCRFVVCLVLWFLSWVRCRESCGFVLNVVSRVSCRVSGGLFVPAKM